jgi:hypothetical protein
MGSVVPSLARLFYFFAAPWLKPGAILLSRYRGYLIITSKPNMSQNFN